MNNEIIINGVLLSAYIININNEETIVLGKNISDVMHKLETLGIENYEFKHSKSLNIIL